MLGYAQPIFFAQVDATVVQSNKRSHKDGDEEINADADAEDDNDEPKTKRRNVDKAAAESSHPILPAKKVMTVPTNGKATSNTKKTNEPERTPEQQAKATALRQKKIDERTQWFNKPSSSKPDYKPADPVINITIHGKVYPGIPSAHEAPLRGPGPLKKWLELPDAHIHWTPVGGILKFPCTREQGRFEKMVCPSRIEFGEWVAWYEFEVRKGDKNAIGADCGCHKHGKVEGPKKWNLKKYIQDLVNGVKDAVIEQYTTKSSEQNPGSKANKNEAVQSVGKTKDGEADEDTEVVAAKSTNADGVTDGDEVLAEEFDAEGNE